MHQICSWKSIDRSFDTTTMHMQGVDMLHFFLYHASVARPPAAAATQLKEYTSCVQKTEGDAGRNAPFPHLRTGARTQLNADTTISMS